MRTIKRRSGFSLLELLLVVTLLGVLVVTALPRFLDRETGSDTVYLERVAGALEAGAALFHAQWIAAGRPQPNVALPGFEPLRAGPAGYPYGINERSEGGPGLATSADCVALFRGLLGAAAPTVVAASDRKSPADPADPGSARADAKPADFTALVAGTECHFFLTRDGVAGKFPMLRYDADRGRTELEHRVALPLPG